MRTDPRQELLRHYERELNYLRRAGAEFGARYPKVAQRLGLSDSGVSDPHIGLLMESFAFLTARIQSRIEAEFPEISASLLGILYPHFTNPIPSMTIAQFEVDPDQGITEPVEVTPHTSLYARASSGEACNFRTCYPTRLWPLDVVNASAEHHPEMLGLPRGLVGVVGAVRVKLRSHEIPFSKLKVDRLRFYIHGGELSANQVYELLFCNTVRVAIRTPDEKVRLLPKDSLAQVGLDDEGEVLPMPKHSLPGYRILQEYFAFPQQYRFIDVINLDGICDGPEAELLFLTDVDPPDSLNISSETFQLGCTPVINLFERLTEPVRFDARSPDYRLIADARREPITEIHSVLEVMSASPGAAKARSFAPFYAFRYDPQAEQETALWHTTRRLAERRGIAGTEMFISFMDPSFKPTQPAEDTIYARVLCTNRDLAERVPAGVRLELEDALPVKHVSALLKPTVQLDPPLGGPTLWMLVSHLALNHLSLSSDEESLHALRGLLKLYATSNPGRADKEIGGIVKMQTRPVVRRLGNSAWRGFCRGTEVTLTFNEREYVGSSAFMLASVLDRFFALHAAVNSFTELVIKSNQRSGIWKRWPPKSGLMPLL